MNAAAPKNIATKPAEGGAMRAAAARKAMTTQAMMKAIPKGPTRNCASAVSARVTVREGVGEELVELLAHLSGAELSGLEDELTVQRRKGPDGERFSVYELSLPVSEKELKRFERELRTEIDGFELRLPESVEIELGGELPE